MDLPSEAFTAGDNFVYGGRMVPSPDNTGVILYTRNRFYELYCRSEDTCSWFVKTQTTEVSREDFPVMMYVPEAVAGCKES